MSPFDLRGPDFLVFYLILSAIVLFVLYLFGRASEPSGATKADLSDPYLIAYLRGAKNELLRVATVSLIHRGMLKVSGATLSIASAHIADGVRIPLEKELLLHFAKPNEATSVFSESRFSSSAQSYAEYLESHGLLPDHMVRADRWRRLGLTIAILWGFASIKIIVALSRGHSNIEFLMALTAIVTFVAYRINNPRLTLRGKEMLEDLRLLLAGLKERASKPEHSPTVATSISSHALPPALDANELTLLAAVFGIGAIPVSTFPYARALYPRATSGNSPGASTSSCGGCGGGGGSCGGGCGGGGCGGCGS